MEITIKIEKNRAGIYSDKEVFDSFVDLIMALERFWPHDSIPSKYIKKEIAKAKRLEYLAKALVTILNSIKESK
jgi:hypothetical protein